MVNRFTFKIVGAGDGGVGKTTLMHRYLEDRFIADTMVTVGVEIFHHTVKYSENTICDLQLWDFGGQEQFRFFQEKFVRGASGALLLFDLTMMKSFINLKEWLKVLRGDNPKFPILLIGSKFDLTEKISVSDEDITNFVKENDFIGFLKASSKTGYNVNESFKALTTAVLKFKSVI